jgi:imidazole glycerol-phosphate synthase subunit HisH
MSRKTIGIVDYGVGNHASVYQAFKNLNYRCIISSVHNLLEDSDLLVLPGVGAFPSAMESLNDKGLASYLQKAAQNNTPIIGLCLGMQLLAEESLELGKTKGLGLIPGKVIPLQNDKWHIGWNTIHVTNNDNLILPSDGESFYFNHSFFFNSPVEYQICISSANDSFPVGVRFGNIVGLQFHPEKSQRSGQILLKNLVEGLTSV